MVCIGDKLLMGWFMSNDAVIVMAVFRLMTYWMAFGFFAWGLSSAEPQMKIKYTLVCAAALGIIVTLFS